VRILRFPLPTFVLLTALLASGARADEPSTLAVFEATVSLDGQAFSVPVRATTAGPLFSLAPLVGRLGGELENGAYGESFALVLLQQKFVFGPGSLALTSGEEIVDLSQPPASSVSGVMVPIDFLESTYAKVLGYHFAWNGSERRLTVERVESRTLLVRPELVHLQGTTTLAFEFSEPPRYRMVNADGVIEVEVGADFLRLAGRPPGRDSMVDAVTVGDHRIRIHLAPGTGFQSYVLQRPFRLVFDFFPKPVTQDSPQALRPPSRRGGIRTIVIDPGHGGSETGAVGRSGLVEKDVTLELARLLKARLESRMAVRVVLTREEDLDLALEARTAVANQNKADLFISLHLNSSFGSRAQGAETYILSSEASDSAAAAAAAQENQEEEGGGADPLYDLQLILWDMSQSHHLAASLRFASLVQEELNLALDLRDRGVKQAPFRVLMGAAMPAVLVELGFVSNPAEEGKLQGAEYRSQLVSALVQAVLRYKAIEEGRPVAPELPQADDAAAPEAP
jgi:N-acetylmuramoyl-L-alanine amidase